MRAPNAVSLTPEQQLRRLIGRMGGVFGAFGLWLVGGGEINRYFDASKGDAPLWCFQLEIYSMLALILGMIAWIFIAGWYDGAFKHRATKAEIKELFLRMAPAFLIMIPFSFGIDRRPIATEILTGVAFLVFGGYLIRDSSRRLSRDFSPNRK